MRTLHENRTPIPSVVLVVSTLIVLLLIFLTSYSGMVGLRVNPVYYLAVLLTIALAGILIKLERKEYSVQQLVMISLLSVLSSGMRILFAPVPSLQPSTFLIIMVAVVYGAEIGGFVGILTPFLSNMVLGQGIHTPFMMAGWGIVGYVAGLIYPMVKRKDVFLYVYSFVSGYLYGWVTNLSMLIFYPPTLLSIIVVYSMSFWFDTIHSLGNLLFLHFFGGPVKAILEKKKRKMMVRIL